MILGLTGGPGTGKSLAAEYLKKHGAVILSGDDAGKRAVEDYPSVLNKLIKTFGDGIINSDGTLDRKSLGRLVFADSSALSALNSIIHPQLLKILKSDRKKYCRRRSRLVVIDAALIYEWGIADWCDYILVVTARRDIRIQRLRARGLSRGEAINRIMSQIPDKDKAQLADFVIRNNSTKASLQVQVKQLLEKITTPSFKLRLRQK